MPPRVAIRTIQRPSEFRRVESELSNDAADPFALVLPMGTFLEKRDGISSNFEAYVYLLTKMHRHTVFAIACQLGIDLVSNHWW
jgi:hypothetical protein